MIDVKTARCLSRQQLAAGLLLALSSVGVAGAQTPSWRVATAGSTTQASGTSQTMATAVDANGNVFVTGYFAGSVTFGSTTLSNAGGNDLFVAKWVPGNGTGVGSWAWAQRGGGTGDDAGLGIAVSGSSVYVTGYITNTTANASGVTFGSTAVAGATSTSSTDLVVARFVDNTTSAALGWTQVGGGTGADQGQGIAVSGTSVYATGFITNDRANTNAVVFGSAGATVAQYGASTTVSSDVVVAKYTDNTTSATRGWTQVGGGTSADAGQAIAVGSSGVYVTGYISTNKGDASVVRFGGAGATAGTVPQNGAGGTSASATIPDLVLAKYTDNGTTATLGWTQVGGGTDQDMGLGLAVSSTTVYVTGYLTNNANDTKKVLFGGSGTTAGTSGQLGTSAAGTDLLVAKYTDNGTSATFGWTQIGGGTGDDAGRAVVASGSSVYVTGSIANNSANASNVLFGGSGSTVGTTSQSGASTTTSTDIVLANYTDNGTNATVNWTQVGGGAGTDQGQGIGLRNTIIYVVGYTVPTATFGSLSVDNPAGSNVNFLGQLSVLTPLPVELTDFSATLATDGTAVHLAWATASEANSAWFEAERSLDGVHFVALGKVAAAGSSSGQHPYVLTDATLPARTPTLYYRLQSVDLDGTATYSPVRAVVVRAASRLALFPNPTNSTTTLTGAPAGSAVQVLDALGKVVATAVADTTGTATFTVPASLLRGLYVVRSGTQTVRLAVSN
ncbi:MAG: T9SS type A sorting domain-containing protein [Hymenobacter sp.]|nr:MAG: T9SS type A sorting domain-containing protein [Hymenobacter sp.]